MSDEKMVKLVYVGPHSEVEVPALGILAVRGEPVDVRESDAGSAPKGDPADEDYEPGEGLLAQSVWVKAGTKAAKEAPPPAETTGVELLEPPAADAVAETPAEHSLA